MNNTIAVAQGVALDMLNRWTEAFNRGDSMALASLYTADAHLFGGKPDLYAGQARVQAYFDAVPAGPVVSFDPPAVTAPVPDTVCLATVANFARDGEPLPRRFSLTLVRDDDGGWRIASHHASKLT